CPGGAGFPPVGGGGKSGRNTPNPPVQLVLMGGQVRALGVADSQLDVTPVLSVWVREQAIRLEALDALILKSRSPSCGLGDVPVFSVEREVLREHQDGLFASWVREHFPCLVLYSDVWLEESQQQAEFLSLLMKKNAGS
ncbi:2-thiouracil desulfurase family protein, partial [Thiolapillus sp.]